MARSFCAVALSAASYGWGLSTTLLNWTRVCVTNNTNTQTKGARAIARAVIVHTLRTLPPHTNTGAQAHMQALMGVCVCKIVCRCHDAGIFGTVPNQGRVRRLPSSAFDCCPENAYKLCVVVVVGVCVCTCVWVAAPKESTNKRCFDCNLLSSQICVILPNTHVRRSRLQAWTQQPPTNQPKKKRRVAAFVGNLQIPNTRDLRRLDLPRRAGRVSERVCIIIIIITSANTLRLISELCGCAALGCASIRSAC